MTDDDSKKAEQGIVTALQSYPLYRPFRYKARLKLERSTGGGAGLPLSRIEYLLLPQEIELHCSQCNKTQRWQLKDSPEIFELDPVFLHHKKYICKNCSKETVHYFFYWIETEGEGHFFKVGQFPPLETQPPADLKLTGEDIDFYRKALTSRNFSFGIGALAYLRRVVENRMNALIDLVLEVAQTDSNFSREAFEKLKNVRETGSFEEKARIAAKNLPSYLRPGGSNPFDILADFASQGLHDESEEECLKIFDRVRNVFEYLFRNLVFTSTEAKKYVDSLSKLSGSKS